MFIKITKINIYKIILLTGNIFYISYFYNFKYCYNKFNFLANDKVL